MQFFGKVISLDELKLEYRRLCRIYHPDLGGDAETMKLLNTEYEEVLNTTSFQTYFAHEDTKTTADVERAMREVIEKLIVLEGITIEICGTWLWITGNTYPVKDRIKEAGCKFASKKKMWYWRSSDNKTRNKKTYTMEEIRKAHGSRVIDSEGTGHTSLQGSTE